jgi:hypothetical protein
MSILTSSIYDRLASDGTLTGMLSTYEGNPAIFTTDPAPGNASKPYIVTVGEVSQAAFDTKTTRGRSLIRDVRCYAAANGSAIVVEAIAERVRALLHRQALVIDGFSWLVSEANGPIVADETDAYGRIVSLRLIAQES